MEKKTLKMFSSVFLNLTDGCYSFQNMGNPLFSLLTSCLLACTLLAY